MAICEARTSEFVKNSDKTILELAGKPCIELMESSLFSEEIDTLILSTCAAEQYGAPMLAEMLGIKPKVCQRLDNLCNSGTNAIVTAYSMISSGLSEVALVVGAEKRESPGNQLLHDSSRGSFSLPVHWAAMFAKAHMNRYGTTEEQLAKVSVKNRANATRNPNALFKNRVTVDEVLSSKKIVDPLKLLDCSAPCDGSAAVLLASEKKARRLERPVWVSGVGQQTNSASFANATSELSRVDAASAAAGTAYRMAKTKPSEIDVAEVHDAFSILEVIAIEDLRFAKRGKGGESVGSTATVINARGGLIGSGHPVGATGIAQVVEVFEQLTGRAGSRQVPTCKLGLVHNLAAAGSSATVIILSTES